MSMKSIQQVIIRITQTFARKTGDYAHITRLSMEIKRLETKMHLSAQNLGMHAFELIKESALREDKLTISECEKIEKYKTKIEQLQSEIREIRKSTTTIKEKKTKQSDGSSNKTE